MNGNNFTNAAYNTFKYGFIITLASLVNINVFTSGFKMSIGVMCYAVFLFSNRNFPRIPVTIFMTFGVLIARLATDLTRNTDLSITDHIPEALFFLMYGFALFIYTWYRRDFREHLLTSCLFITVIDYGCNIIELLNRGSLELSNPRVHLALISLAIVRSGGVFLFMTFINRYGKRLIDKEREERYKRLVLLTSRLGNELRWLKKSTESIEATMNDSYSLYNKLLAKGDEYDARTALQVASNIHDIKKEYLLILRGITESINMEISNDGMYMSEIMRLVDYASNDLIGKIGKPVSLEISMGNNLYTKKHYPLMSVIFNLCTNAIEASHSNGIIYVEEMVTDNQLIIKVTNNGDPIPDEYKNKIFEAGFSTKINYSTGEISRGLGLNLVKEIVYNELGGSINFNTNNKRTVFTVTIPVDIMTSEE